MKPTEETYDEDETFEIKCCEEGCSTIICVFRYYLTKRAICMECHKKYHWFDFNYECVSHSFGKFKFAYT
jgi:hypothetical protein